MAKLYREIVLKEKPADPGFVPVEGLIASARKEREEVGSFGD